MSSDDRDPAVPQRPPVLIVDRKPLYLSIIAEALSAAGLDTVEFAGELSGVVDAAAQSRSPVAVLGPSLPAPRLAPVVTALLAAGTRSLVLADTSMTKVAATVLLAGASGYLHVRDTSPDELAQAVVRVRDGASALHPDVVHTLLVEWRQARETTAAASAPESELTAREVDTLRGLRDGLTTRQLAARLGIAEKTVEAHKSRLFAKLGVKGQAHAVSEATARGLL